VPPDPPGSFLAIQQVGWSSRQENRLRANRVGVPSRPPSAVRRVSSAVRLPLPDGVGQVRHPRGGFRADRLQGHAARVHALEQADPGAEQHGRQRDRELVDTELTTSTASPLTTVACSASRGVLPASSTPPLPHGKYCATRTFKPAFETT
jgi:hypothetical protein